MLAAVQAASGGPAKASNIAAPGCQLGNGIKHVIYVQFDNTHFRRDNPNVPSDLEQMPHLLNYLRGNGTLMTNDHTALISHTATGILTSLTGVYPDRMGQPVSNSFRYFNPNGTTNLGVAFAYWTAPLFDPTTSTPTDTTPQMINENGKIAPAPWVPFTRAGCDFGSIGTANTVLENTAVDIPTVFGPGSPEAQEVKSNPDQAFADFVGIAVHCTAASVLCSPSNNGRPDVLSDEPGGYNGYNGLFGAKNVDPVISPTGPMTDLDGNVIADQRGHIGFPGFDGMSASVSLSWVATMQERGIPVTYAYISDAHDAHPKDAARNRINHFAYGPGEAGYVAQLRAYDQAFGTFFQRLAADGITKDNTLFVATVDEGDHFVGSAPSPTGCDGVSVACSYSQVGEVNANLRGLVATQTGNTTPFTVHSDDAPNVYVTGNPVRDSLVARNLERDTGKVTATNPYTGNTDHVTVAMADPVEEATLHMVTADPARTPTFTMFGNPDYFFFAGAPNCSSPCVSVPNPPPDAANPDTFAWNHGDIQPEIATTWVGYVGPGVRNLGASSIWTDHTDVRPTMLTLLGLKDDYIQDGRTVVEPLYDWAVPQTLRAHREWLLRLGAAYKQLTAPFGEFGSATLEASTRALESGTNGVQETPSSTYTRIENRIASLTADRNALALTIRNALNAAAFSGQALDEQQAKAWTAQADALIAQAQTIG
ncbi:MAG: hypothetical protein WBB74_01890 [Gaiellaceae bacterium]